MDTNPTTVPPKQIKLTTNSVGESAKLAALKHFPQPVFLLDRNSQLLETNKQGEKAIDNHWVGIQQNKLHFNNSAHNTQIEAMIANLYEARALMRSQQMPSKRFILRNIDMEFRAYTMTIESPESDNILLFIQGDLNCSVSKMHSLTMAFSLSNSESKIVKLMVEGLKPKEIAYELSISLNTVRSHLRTIYAKMQVNSYNDALTCAIKLLV